MEAFSGRRSLLDCQKLKQNGRLPAPWETRASQILTLKHASTTFTAKRILPLIRKRFSPIISTVQDFGRISEASLKLVFSGRRSPAKNKNKTFPKRRSLQASKNACPKEPKPQHKRGRAVTRRMASFDKVRPPNSGIKSEA